MARLGILDALGNPRYVGWQTPPIPPPDPDPPGDITHGDDVRRWNVGRPDDFYAEDTRTPLAAPTVRGYSVFTSAHSNTVVRNVRFTSNVVIQQGCDNIRFEFCIFDPPAARTGYAVWNYNGGGRAYFYDCTFLGKYGRGKTILLQGSGGMWFERCLILGSEDVIHSTAQGPQPFPSVSCQDFSGARIVILDSFLGDGVRATDGHVDVIQWDSQGGDLICKRSRLMSYSMTEPAVPRSSQGSPTNPGNGVFLATYGNNPGTLGRFSFEDCRFDGGNYCINAAPPDGPAPQIMAVRGCTFGADAPFTSGGDTYIGAVRYGWIRGGNRLSDNTWAATGDYLLIGGGGGPSVRGVTAGAPI